MISRTSGPTRSSQQIVMIVPKRLSLVFVHQQPIRGFPSSLPKACARDNFRGSIAVITRRRNIIDANHWNSMWSVSLLGCFPEDPRPADAQRRSEPGADRISSSQAARFQRRPDKRMSNTTPDIATRVPLFVASSSVTRASGRPCVDRLPPPTDRHS
jgi:hypothetical protein